MIGVRNTTHIVVHVHICESSPCAMASQAQPALLLAALAERSGWNLLVLAIACSAALFRAVPRSPKMRAMAIFGDSVGLTSVSLTYELCLNNYTS